MQEENQISCAAGSAGCQFLKPATGENKAQPNFATIEPYKNTGAAMYFSGSAGFCKKRYPLRGCYLRMGTSIARISQSEIAQFAFGKLGAPSLRSSSYAGVFRALRSAT